MFELHGQNGKANVYANQLDERTIAQIIHMLNSRITKDATLRIMPDAHLGKGSTIGTTIQLPNNRQDWYISPNVVGVDIGCGIMSCRLMEKLEDIDLQKLDEAVHSVIVSGSSFRSKAYNEVSSEALIKQLTFKPTAKREHHTNLSLGTLGGGNHFIELAQDDDGYLWLTIHSGSRTLGTTVAMHHQDIADNIFDTEYETGDKHFAGLAGNKLQDYLADVRVAALFANKNRAAMIQLICAKANLTCVDCFDSIHNYIDEKNGVIRKGATAAYEGQRLIIPLNMRDGSLICTGKANNNWNCSAPHGAGRQLSRSSARHQLDFKTYQQVMNGVYSSTIKPENIDESPMAYKPKDDIIEAIADTVSIEHYLRPIYNFKA